MSWHGYGVVVFLDIAPNVDTSMRAIEKMGKLPYRSKDGLVSHKNAIPSLITSVAKGLSGKSILFELSTEEDVTTDQVSQAIADELGVGKAAADALFSSIDVFSGDTYEERRVATMAYQKNNPEDWDE